MKQVPCKRVAEAFSLVELLVVAAMLALAAALLIPAMNNRPATATVPHCLSNLRQVGCAFQMFADDNNGQFPTQVSITNGGSLEFIGSNSPALHFRTLSSYLGRGWSVWHCPADRYRDRILTHNTWVLRSAHGADGTGRCRRRRNQ